MASAISTSNQMQFETLVDGGSWTSHFEIAAAFTSRPPGAAERSRVVIRTSMPGSDLAFVLATVLAFGGDRKVSD